MNTTTISQLKMNPSAVIAQAADYPVAVANRNTVTAYVVGKQLFERLTAYLEDRLDGAAVASADFSKGKDFEKVARDLGI
ncbi:type II toxin-antitoxin system Phd/YefM family antitoxin [Candidatus Gottesmanbacteria bacterium]|nr:type II toxin-antitoxin system Phd/YefM family antitoxin [Candidatus Gottesmanbacteria bacterium]